MMDSQIEMEVRDIVEQEIVCFYDDPRNSGYLFSDFDHDDLDDLLSNIRQALAETFGHIVSLGSVDEKKALEFRAVQKLTDYLVSCVTEN